MRNINLQFEDSCAGCSHMHGANHDVLCDAGQLVDRDGVPRVYHLDKAYSNPYQWPSAGIPYKSWLVAKSCVSFNSSENGNN